jgi:MFS family permease
VTLAAARRVYTVTVFVVLAALDNVALAMPPPLLRPISRDLGVAQSSVGLVVAVNLFLTAVAAVAWAYLGDRSDRKRVLMAGTLLWAAGVGATGFVTSYPAFFAAQALAGIGLGAVASVGFSVVSDLVSPRRRGLVMGLWGLSQGVGSLVGIGLATLLGNTDWQAPFRVLAVVGVVAVVAYLFTTPVRRGESEPQLRELYAKGGEYDHRISRADLPQLAARRTNVWLVAQGLTAQMVFGSLAYLPVLFQAKAEAIGYEEGPAIAVSGVFTVLVFSGGVLSLLGGLIGDRLQRRNPRARALVAAIGVFAAIPLFLGLFFFPLRLDLARDEADERTIVRAVLSSVVTEPAMAATFLVALVAIALISAQSPNWYALIAEVNPPEHRGTAFSLGNLANGTGRALGTDLVVRTFDALARPLPPPMNYAVGLAAFQLLFLPTGACYLLASRSSPRDIAAVDQLLRDRAASDMPNVSPSGDRSISTKPSRR